MSKLPQQASSVNASRPAAAYLRVSSQEQADEGLSLDAQRKNVAAYADLHGLELVETITDPAVSAGAPLGTRPGGERLLGLVDSGAVKAVVAVKLDRLFRDASDCLTITRAWDRAGVALHLLDLGGQSVDTSSAMGRLFLTVMAGVAEAERNQTSDRIRTVLRFKEENGVWHGSTPPLGYTRTERAPQAGDPMRISYQLVPDPDMGPVVTGLFTRFINGENLSELCRWFNEAGYRTHRGTELGHASLRVILSNPIYAGVMVRSRGEEALVRQAVNVQPLLAPETVAAAQERLAQLKQVRPRSRASTALFSGILYCGACGQRFWRASGTSVHGTLYYRCRSTIWTRGCGQPTAEERLLLEDVLPHLRAALSPDALASRTEAATTEEAELRARMGVLDRQAEALLELRLAHAADPLTGISEPAYTRRIGPLHAEMSEIRAKLTALSPPAAALHDAAADLDALLEHLTRPQLRDLLRATFCRVEILNGGLHGTPILR